MGRVIGKTHGVHPEGRIIMVNFFLHIIEVRSQV